MGEHHKHSKPGQHHLTISKEVIKMLRYLKEPAGTIAELYSRYPDGGEWGWFAIVTSLQTIVIWDVDNKKWLPVSSGDGGTVITVQADWNETDSQKPGFIKNKPNVISSILPNKLLDENIADPQKGKYYLDEFSNLTYATILSDGNITLEEVIYGGEDRITTTYLLFQNGMHEKTRISFPEGLDFYISIDSYVDLEPFEFVEIAIKGYGFYRFLSFAKLLPY